MHMRCPDGIGREIWEWVGRMSVGCLEKKVPPTEWGKKPSPRWSHLRDETGRPENEVIVAVVVVVVVVVGCCCCCLLFVVCCLLLVVCCLLFVVCYLLFVVC